MQFYTSSNDHTVMDHYTRVLTMQCLDREVQISSKKNCTEIKQSSKGTCKRLSIDPFWISFFLCFFLCFEICFYLYINLVWITEAL